MERVREGENERERGREREGREGERDRETFSTIRVIICQFVLRTKPETNVKSLTGKTTTTTTTTTNEILKILFSQVTHDTYSVYGPECYIDFHLNQKPVLE